MQYFTDPAYAPYENDTDEALIKKIKAGDKLAEDIMYEKYKPFVKAKTRIYFLAGADREDLVQEGMLGLYKAVRDYDGLREEKSAFRSFAELCIRRQVITAIKAATRKKHAPLNTYVSLNKPAGTDETSRALSDVLSAAHISDPEEALISRESYEALRAELAGTLSELERKTLMLYLDGLSYVEIGAALGRPAKTIDNALQRIKKKLLKLLPGSEG